MHTKSLKPLKRRKNRHHPSSSRRKNHPRMTASHQSSDFGVHCSIGQFGLLADLSCARHRGLLSGRTGLVHVRRVLKQQLLALVRTELSAMRRSSPDPPFNQQKRVESKLPFRCTLPELERRGTNRAFAALAPMTAFGNRGYLYRILA
jgi:hypothetical protein